MLALPGSLIQWIFWFFTGARLRASHENSQSLQRRMAEENKCKRIMNMQINQIHLQFFTGTMLCASHENAESLHRRLAGTWWQGTQAMLAANEQVHSQQVVT
jgi:hypothetical protein